MFWFNWSWPARILSVLGLFFAAMVIFPIFGRARDPHGHRNYCPSYLKQIGLGFAQYIQDYDEKLPLVTSSGGSYGWADALYPYMKSTQIFQCPDELNPGQSDSKLTGYTDYLFNAQLQNRAVQTVGNPARLILATDGNDGMENTDARYAKTAIPAAWRTDPNSPSFRHRGTANYLFIDGHTKAVKIEQISTNWSQNHFFFQPKQ